MFIFQHLSCYDQIWPSGVDPLPLLYYGRPTRRLAIQAGAEERTFECDLALEKR
jgi:hypothetical protein